MTESTVQEKITSMLKGISITKEQALLALESVIDIKTNELLLEGYRYNGTEFEADDIRYEYLALQLVHDLLKKEIIKDKTKDKNFEKER